MRVSATARSCAILRLLGRLVGGDLRLLRLLVAQRPLARQLGALDGAADLHLALLLQPRIFALAVDLQHAALGFEVLVADLDHRLLLDLVAHLAARLDRLGQLRQALGVEGVRRVEMLQAGLVDVDEGDVLQLEAVIGERLGRLLADAHHEMPALFVDLLQRHLRGDLAERGGELAFEEVADAFRMHGAAAERLRGDRDGFAPRLHAQEELGDQVDAHAVARDQRIRFAAAHLDAHDVHVDRRHLVQHRDDEGAAIDDDLFAAEAGPHEGGLHRGAAVEPAQQIGGDHHEDRQHDQPEDDLPQDLVTHRLPSRAAPPSPRRSRQVPIF